VVIDDAEVIQLVAVTRAGEEVSEICGLPCPGVGGAAAKLADDLAEGFSALDWIEVIDLGVNRQEFPAILHGVTALLP
jgi:hypothetical protein